MLIKQIKKQNRHKRLRAKIKGTKERPRLSVFKSNQYIYAQLIDDKVGKTLVGLSDRNFKKNKKDLKRTELSRRLGLLLAEKARDKKIKKVVFDRGGYPYHGRIKAVAEGAREGGLVF